MGARYAVLSAGLSLAETVAEDGARLGRGPLVEIVYSTPDAMLPAQVSFNPVHGVAEHARSRPRNVGLVVDGRTCTYQELASLAGRFARWLDSGSEGGASTRRVGVLASRSFEAYVGILGACWSGATYIPINPRSPPARIANIVARASLDALVVDSLGMEQLTRLGSVAPARILGPAGAVGVDGLDILGRLAPVAEPAPVSPEHTAYVIFTSGTTGEPKGAMVTAGGLRHLLEYFRSLYQMGPEDRVAQYSEIAFDISVVDIFMAWGGAAELHVVPATQTMSVGAFIEKHRPTYWASVPSVAAILSRTGQLKPGAFPSLRATFFGGEALPLALALAWQKATPNGVVDNHYGPTEITVACSFYRLSDPPKVTEGRGYLSIGLPFPGVMIEMVGEDGRFLPDGQAGELAVFGPGVAAGYLSDDELTRRKFPTLAHPRHGVGRWYLTGDHAMRGPDGYLHFLGRVDNQIKIMGHRIELEDIDAHLRSICASDAVAAVGWPVEDGKPVGLVAAVSGCTLEPREVLAALKQRVPPYMVPRRVLVLPNIPLSGNGKVDRRAIIRRLEAEPG